MKDDKEGTEKMMLDGGAKDGRRREGWTAARRRRTKGTGSRFSFSGEEKDRKGLRRL